MLTVDYIQANQKDHQHNNVMKQIFIHINDLIDARNYKAIDDFIEEFCKQKICFQYYVCLLVAALWVEDEIENIPILRLKAIEAGDLEIGHENSIKTLDGLL